MKPAKARTEGLEAQHLRKLIRQCLERRAAADMESLVRFVGMDQAAIGRGLEAMIAEGEVEVLRPCAPPRGVSATISHPRQHFRLLRDTDGDYEWQRGSIVRLPSGGMSDILGHERRAGLDERPAWQQQKNIRHTEVLAFKYS